MPDSFLIETGVNLIIAIFGSFFGLIGALFFTKQKEKAELERKVNNFLDAVAKELSDVCPFLTLPNKGASVVIFLPNWDVLKQTGIILETLDLNVYPIIISIYSDLEYLNWMSASDHSINEHIWEKTVKSIYVKFEELCLDPQFASRIPSNVREWVQTLQLPKN